MTSCKSFVLSMRELLIGGHRGEVGNAMVLRGGVPSGGRKRGGGRERSSLLESRFRPRRSEAAVMCGIDFLYLFSYII